MKLIKTTCWKCKNSVTVQSQFDTLPRRAVVACPPCQAQEAPSGRFTGMMRQMPAKKKSSAAKVFA